MVGVGEGVGVTGREGVGGVGVGMSVPLPGSVSGGVDGLFTGSSDGSSEGDGLGLSSSSRSPKILVGLI